MKNGKLLYFTQAELEVMLELAGGPEYLIYRTEPPPDAASLTRAMVSLYRRGLLIRPEVEPAGRTAFALSERGMFFREVRAAPITVILTARYPRENTAAFYGGDGETLWLLEVISTVLSRETRLRCMDRRELKAWFFNTGILDPPLLKRSDADELSALLNRGESDRSDIAAVSVRLRLEKYKNGGESLGEYEILEKSGVPTIRVREDRREWTELYTEEALRVMLDRAFQKGQP